MNAFGFFSQVHIRLNGHSIHQRTSFWSTARKLCSRSSARTPGWVKLHAGKQLEQLWVAASAALQCNNQDCLQLVFHRCWVCSSPPLCSAISRTRPQGGSNRGTAAVTHWKPHPQPACTATWTRHQHFEKDAFNSTTNSAVLVCINCGRPTWCTEQSTHTRTHTLYFCVPAMWITWMVVIKYSKLLMIPAKTE